MPSHTYFFTGFPGFIATRLVEKLFDQDPSSRFLLLVHPSQQEKAEKVISQLTQKKAGSRGCFSLIPGDITKENLDIPQQRLERLREEIDYVFHLAAIYDLAVSQGDGAIGWCNVTGHPKCKRFRPEFIRIEAIRLFQYRLCFRQADRPDFGD